ncbi:MAG: hypothetical protein HY040_01645 [Planctomycetes bacterium]|nr:hypothetical protein [Planctomycetota bacterium]
MDARTQTILQDLVRKEGRSLLQYVGESFPWTTAKNHDALPVLFQMVKEEQDGAAAIVRLLMKRKVRPPYLGAYPMSYTTINYISLDHLLPYLVDFEKRRIAELERELPLLDDVEARATVLSLLDTKRRHLQNLSEIQARG